jgi:hypothetical protein
MGTSGTAPAVSIDMVSVEAHIEKKGMVAEVMPMRCMSISPPKDSG